MKKPENTDRKQIKDTRFKPGQSGNPAGKPRGARHKTTLAAQALMDGESDALTRKAIDLALEGDMVALRLCLDRILPPSKERPVKIRLPDTSTAEGLSSASEMVLQAVSAGELLPAEGTVISNMIEKRRVALETLDFEKRIAALEKNK